MKLRFILLLTLYSSLGLKAQHLTDTLESNKKVILEEFSGTSCHACPTAHVAVKALLDTNDNVVSVAYSPANHILTDPWNGGADLRRNFPILFFTDPYFNNGSGRSMPSFFVNRRVFAANTNGGRRLSTSQISNPIDSIQLESSPINMGVESNFNANTNELDIEVELYFRQAISNFLGLHVLIIEDSVEATQNGSSLSPYYHNHLFRESLTGQWGDAILTTTNAGDYANLNFKFDLADAIDPLDVENCQIVAFVYDINDGEHITAIQVEAKNGTTRVTPTSLTQIEKTESFRLYPNPASHFIHISFQEIEKSNLKLEIANSMGQTIHIEELDQGQTRANINTAQFPRGLYFVTIAGAKSTIRQPLLLK